MRTEKSSLLSALLYSHEFFPLSFISKILRGCSLLKHVARRMNGKVACEKKKMDGEVLELRNWTSKAYSDLSVSGLGRIFPP